MASRSDIPKEIKHLTLVWVRDVGDSTAQFRSKSSKGKSKEPKAPTKAAASVTPAPAELEPTAAPGGENADVFETCRAATSTKTLPTVPDDYFETLNDVDPKEIEKTRLRL